MRGLHIINTNRQRDQFLTQKYTTFYFRFFYTEG